MPKTNLAALHVCLQVKSLFDHGRHNAVQLWKEIQMMRIVSGSGTESWIPVTIISALVVFISPGASTPINKQ